MNQLAQSSSVYLQQHAQNPVHWQMWSNAIFTKAAQEQKLLLVSIGYSTCHWCHVMEHESFEDQAVADLMNQHFVCVKVDREEHPDVDQLYMSALQLMTGQGGWPLNVVCLADGSPIYGGTYFRKADWMQTLQTLVNYVQKEPEQALAYANKLKSGISQLQQLVKVDGQLSNDFDFNTIANNWKNYIDTKEGGFARAPKFPLPNALQAELYLGLTLKDQELLCHVETTLEKMYLGGIYDHINGAFARYSTDALWHIPHFEKMLYDNAQLMSIYAESYHHQPKAYKKVVLQRLIDFLNLHCKQDSEGFASGIDADSEGKEGKFHSFSYSELQDIFKDEFLSFSSYFDVKPGGNWEEESTNILIAKPTYLDDGYQACASYLQTLKFVQEQRVPPITDSKHILSWNAMLLKGFCDTYWVLQDSKLRLQIEAFAKYLLYSFKKEQGYARIRMKGKLEHQACLDDYAFLLQALIQVYNVLNDEQYLLEAKSILESIERLFDSQQGFYRYTSSTHLSPIFEIHDNVIPSSNAIMAHDLLYLGQVFAKSEWIERAEAMTSAVMKKAGSYPASYSQWIQNALLIQAKVPCVIIDNQQAIADFKQSNFSNYLMLMNSSNSTFPILQGKTHGKGNWYLCTKNACTAPKSNISALFE